jgi:uncharacterized protein YeaO (DUF488 family)
MTHELRVLRVYDLTEETEGYRVLVDRLWPRGLRKESLRLDRWAREVTPSPELRKWFGHTEERFAEFSSIYRAELDSSSAAQDFVRDMASILQHKDVLLLYAAKSRTCNHAVILRDWMLEQMTQTN